MRSLLRRFRPRTADRAFSPTASEDDVIYSYRLLLNRAPDDHGLAFWRGMLRREQISVETLVRGFIDSQEFIGRFGDSAFVSLLRAARQVELITSQGLHMFIRRDDLFVGKPLAEGHTYEPHLQRVLRAHLGEGSVFVDVGANIGFMSLFAASLHPTIQVHAFEPNLENGELLKLSRARNNLTGVTLYPHAVADRPQSFLLKTYGSNGWLEPLEPDTDTSAYPSAVDVAALAAGEQTQQFLVHAVRLDDTLAHLTRLDLIKMDIEGAEPLAWRGMQQIIRRHRPALVMEFAPAMIQNVSQTDPYAFLEDVQQQGYRLHILAGDATILATPEQVRTHMGERGENHCDILCKVGQPDG